MLDQERLIRGHGSMNHHRNRGLHRTLDLVIPATRVWGIATAIVYWGVGVELTYREYQLGIYLLLTAIILTILETAFAVDIFLDLCVRQESGVLLRLWRIIRWVDLWRKSVLYGASSALCFLWPGSGWLPVVSGFASAILCALYLILTYKNHLEMQDAFSAHDRDDSYDQFEALQEEVDDALPEPDLETVGDQDRILQM